jgi:hypothetical protein
MAGLERKQNALVAKRRELSRRVRQTTLSALLQGLYDYHNVQLRPHTSSQ